MKVLTGLAGILNRGSKYNLTRQLNNQAKNSLKEIEKIKGTTDPKFIKLSDEYAKDVFGWNGYAPWLYVYSAVAEKFNEGWIPANYYYGIVVQKIKGRHGKVSNIKTLTNRIFRKNLFPDIAYYVNGLWISENDRIIPENDVKDFLFKHSETIIFKADNSSQAKGIFLFQRSSFNIKEIISYGNGVVQYYIDQHPFFAQFMPSSVGTLRITTVLDDQGDASVRACYLRIGRGDDRYVKYNRSIWIPVDFKTGELGELGYLDLDTWHTSDRHPDTAIKFANMKIPYFNKFLSTALELQKSMPYVRCIGWDMTIDRNNDVKVMEWNGDNNGIIFGEATQGPCFFDLGWERL